LFIYVNEVLHKVFHNSVINKHADMLMNDISVANRNKWSLNYGAGLVGLLGLISQNPAQLCKYTYTTFYGAANVALQY
jgi:hypothetical protein